MKLTDMKVELIKIPLKKPFRIAFAVQEHSVNVLVKLITDEGVWGIGEAAPFEPVTGENANTVVEVLKLFKQGLLGRDPMDLEGIHQMMDNLISGNTAAKAAVDIALYDIRGKVLGQPLYKVLGGSQNQIVTDMTIGIDKPELMAQEAKERVERDGFTILKVKAGICPKDDIRASPSSGRRWGPTSACGWTPTRATPWPTPCALSKPLRAWGWRPWSSACPGGTWRAPGWCAPRWT